MTTSAYTAAIVVLFGLALSGCEKASVTDEASSSSGNNEASEPMAAVSSQRPQLVIETASPDLAVKSWWKVMDLREKMETEKCKKERSGEKPMYVAYYKEVAQEEMLRALTPDATACQEYFYEREIQEVKAESETRAMVFVKVKNVTPIPVGAEPDDDDLRRRNEWSRFKYLVEKTSDGWKVSQVYKYDEANQYLKRDLWDKVYIPSDKPGVPWIVIQH